MVYYIVQSWIVQSYINWLDLHKHNAKDMQDIVISFIQWVNTLYNK